MPMLVRVNLEQREELFEKGKPILVLNPPSSPFTKGGWGIPRSICGRYTHESLSSAPVLT